MPEGRSDDIALAIERMEAEIARLKSQLSSRDDVRFSPTNVNSHATAREIYELGAYRKGFIDGKNAGMTGQIPLLVDYGLPHRRRRLYLSNLQVSFGRYNPIV